MLPVVDHNRENKQEPSERGDFNSLPWNIRFMSLPNMTVGANAPEVGLPSVTSAELPAVSANSQCVGLSITTFIIPAAPAEDDGIETSLSLGVRLVVTANKVTRVVSSDEGTEPAVTAVTPRRVEPEQETPQANVLMWCD
ncbi:unnamed protein product [Macrosiphum euphorbiae]|nr:unnamed protein product [Macrosiphum euphorbiae]